MLPWPCGTWISIMSFLQVIPHPGLEEVLYEDFEIKYNMFLSIPHEVAGEPTAGLNPSQEELMLASRLLPEMTLCRGNIGTFKLGHRSSYFAFFRTNYQASATAFLRAPSLIYVALLGSFQHGSSVRLRLACVPNSMLMQLKSLILQQEVYYFGEVTQSGTRPTEATFLSALFKRLASARKRRQGHKVSEVASLSQEGPIRIPPLFPFPSAPFPRNEKEDGTLELYYLSAYCLPKILLLQLVGHRVIQISRVFRGFPMLQLPYQFGRSGMDRLNIPLGSLVLTFLCGIHSRSALGITSSSGGNSSQNPTTSPTSLPLTLSRTSIETEWFHVLSPIGYSFPFVSLSPISVSISSQD
ncbi:cytochrome c maturase subunit B [Tanacetum coccineum]|uniref:Cytochrome c maturase subunit B n=1 Tax=Tanacetum coccineum TaxID=301880 RepID=A0ABQ5B9E5_9ASTR